MKKRNFENKSSPMFQELKTLNNILKYMQSLGYPKEEINRNRLEVNKYILEKYKVSLIDRELNENQKS